MANSLGITLEQLTDPALHAALKGAEMRIGHRGLEYRQHDDTYWLNGTQVGVHEFRQEQSRSTAYLEEQMRQAQINAEQQRVKQAEAMRNVTRVSALYGYAPYYPENRHASPDPAQSARPSTRTRKDRKRDVREREKASEAEVGERAKAKPQTFDLRNSPLFGRKAMGPFYNWTFDSPLKPLQRWFLRWAWQTLRAS